MQTPSRGQTLQVPSTILKFLAVGADTNGTFSLFEGRVAPLQGPPPHRHNDDEGYLILEGNFQFEVDGQRFQRGPGEFAFAPKGSVHTFLNLSAEDEGRILFITLPAGIHERFFAEIGELEADFSAPFSMKPPDFEKLMMAGKRHGFEILVPTES
jgi:quercetin dioxygenase-like cupin family protein